MHLMKQEITDSYVFDHSHCTQKSINTEPIYSRRITQNDVLPANTDIFFYDLEGFKPGIGP